MESPSQAKAATKQKLVGSPLFRALMFPTAFLAIATGIFIWETLSLIDAMHRSEQADQVVSRIEGIGRLLTAMETGLKAYATAGDERLLQPYYESEKQIEGRFQELGQVVAGGLGQKDRIARFHTAFIQWQDYARKVLPEQQENGGIRQREMDRLLAGGQGLMELAQFTVSEEQLRKLRLDQARVRQRAILASTAFLALTGFALSAISSRRSIRTVIEKQALRKTHDLLETFVRDAPAGLAMFDRNMHCLHANKRWLQDVGLNGEEIVGKSHHELFPDLPEPWKEAYRRGLAGESVSGEDEWTNVHGDRRTIRWMIQPYGDSGAHTAGIILFSEDISERQKMEDSLRESEERFRTLVLHASDAFFLHDSEGRFIDVNRQATVSLGYTREELLSMSVFDVEEDFDLTGAKEAWRRMKSSTGPITLEGHQRRKDGTRFAHEARLSTYQFGDRQLILALVRDMTDRIRIEEKMRDSEATIHALLDSAAQAILAVNAQGIIVLANRMAGQMFDYATNELLGKELEVLLPRSLQERHCAHRDAFNANPKPRAMGIGLDLLGLRRGGSEFPIEVSLSSVDTKQGLLAVSFVSDITARKKAESDLRESEQRLRMLAGSLLTAQEVERRNLARELHDDVTQQLAFLSIELGRLATELPVQLGETRVRIQTLQNQILNTSTGVRRLSRGLHPSVITDFGLSIALEEFCEEFQSRHGIKVNFDGPVEDSQLSNAEATCLYRVAQESLRNAAVHGRATQIRLELNVIDNFIQLRAVDNGVGFAADPGRSKTGLGIISMTERVRLVNGTFALSSCPGHGTEIAASVPMTGGRE